MLVSFSLVVEVSALKHSVAVRLGKIVGFLHGCALAAAVVLLACQTADAQVLFVADRSVQDHVAELKSQTIQRDSQGYLVPTADQLSGFRSLADGLAEAQTTADLDLLVPEATAIGYDVVVLNDAGSTFYGLQESENAATRKGWGSFFLRQNATNNALVEVVHPLGDINTPEISAQVFVDSEAKGLLLAGAHRNANGFGTADVAHLEQSIFQEVHQSFADSATNLSVWQIHGFNIDGHSAFPAGADAILSSGTGSVSELILGLDQGIDALDGDWTSYTFNNLDIENTLNVATNGDIAGSLFSGLAATTNVQGQYTNSIGGEFIHIELEQSFRIDGGEASRLLISQTIANSIVAAIAVPEPNTVALLGWLSLCLLARRRRLDKHPVLI